MVEMAPGSITSWMSRARHSTLMGFLGLHRRRSVSLMAMNRKALVMEGPAPVMSVNQADAPVIMINRGHLVQGALPIRRERSLSATM